MGLGTSAPWVRDPVQAGPPPEQEHPMQLIHRRHDADHTTVDTDDARDHYHGEDVREYRRVEAPEHRRDLVRERHWDVAPGQIVSLVAGVGFIIMGVIAVARAGLDTPLDTPVVEVLGFSHTAWLGLVEIGAGLLLMLAGLDPFARAGSAVLGVLLVIAGVLIQAIPDDLPRQLALDQDMGTPLIVVGVIVALAALLLPAWTSREVDRRVDPQP
jgi:hypothetical protein